MWSASIAIVSRTRVLDSMLTLKVLPALVGWLILFLGLPFVYLKTFSYANPSTDLTYQLTTMTLFSAAAAAALEPPSNQLPSGLYSHRAEVQFDVSTTGNRAPALLLSVLKN
jgi:hypothetical protein